MLVATEQGFKEAPLLLDVEGKQKPFSRKLHQTEQTQCGGKTDTIKAQKSGTFVSRTHVGFSATNLTSQAFQSVRRPHEVNQSKWAPGCV